MTSHVSSALRLLAMSLAFVFLVALSGSAAPSAVAQQDEKPKPPKSVDVEASVILASKGEVDYADPSLKELAELLQKQFKDQFNRFRLHKVPHLSAQLDKVGYLSLIENYYLKVTYTGVKSDRPEKIGLVLAVVRRVSQTSGDKVETKESTVVGPVTVGIVRDKYLLIAGPPVGEEKLILAVRVLK